jgi:hypothetical protein
MISALSLISMEYAIKYLYFSLSWHCIGPAKSLAQSATVYAERIIFPKDAVFRGKVFQLPSITNSPFVNAFCR